MFDLSGDDSMTYNLLWVPLCGRRENNEVLEVTDVAGLLLRVSIVTPFHTNVPSNSTQDGWRFRRKAH